jgi:ABC-type phosphate/phosphonate transport system permease subunit
MESMTAMGANKQQTVTESILPALCPQIMHPWLQSSEFWDVIQTLVTV